MCSICMTNALHYAALYKALKKSLKFFEYGEQTGDLQFGFVLKGSWTAFVFFVFFLFSELHLKC